MSDDRIYVKTAAGEAAVRERTRLVQRNLRTVLILVDGLADVAALKLKAGDATTVDSAVRELERMGLIGRRQETNDDAEATGAAPSLTFETAEPILTGDWSAAMPVSEPERIHATITPPVGAPSGAASQSSWLKRLRRRRREAREEAVYDAAYGRTVDAPVVEPPQPEVTRSTSAVEPIPRPRRRKARFTPLLLMAGLVALVLAVLRVVFYPYDEYRPRFEAALASTLGDKVSIGNLRVNFLPMPVIVLEKVSVGDTPPYATAEQVRLSPELTSLFTTPRYRRVAVRGMTLAAAGVGRLSRWFKSEGMTQVAVDRVDVENLRVTTGGNSFGPLSGAAHIGPARGIDRIQLGSAESVRVEALPTPAGVSLTLSARNWQAFLAPPIKFTTLEVKGELTDSGFSLKTLEGSAYDGQFSGTGEIGWRDGAQLSLDLDLRHVAVDRLIGALDGAPLLEGNGDAKLKIAGRADRLPQLSDNLRTNGSFTVLRGQLKHVDLAEALRLGAQTPPGAARGGATGFEELRGNFSSDSRAIRLTGVRMASGLMRASGNATLSRGAEPSINGAAAVEISGGSGVGAAVTISGNTLDPELMARR